MSTQSSASPINSFAKHLLANKYIRIIGLVVVMAVFAVFSGVGYAFASSPAAIRNPQFEHAHFRMDLIVNGRPVNFGDKKFQEGYSKDNCTADLTVSPLHFHDSKNQFVHVHWQDMTGGLVLKYYGWNKIGGADGLMGYRFDNGTNLQTVPIYGRVLPAQPADTNFYLYTGTAEKYEQRDFSEFLHEDLETFFGTKSNVGEEHAGILDRLFPKASAHNGVDHDIDSQAATVSAELTDEDLTRINNLLGNVIIFVQDDKPTTQQIKSRFEHLEPLSASTCGG